MSLHYKFQSAVRLLDRLPLEDRPALHQICRRIRDAEAHLQTNAASAMQQCLHNCGGLCCRNTQIDAIISQLDFVYILADDPAYRSERMRRLVLRATERAVRSGASSKDARREASSDDQSRSPRSR